jgi:hypothetical protein
MPGHDVIAALIITRRIRCGIASWCSKRDLAFFHT